MKDTEINNIRDSWEKELKAVPLLSCLVDVNEIFEEQDKDLTGLSPESSNQHNKFYKHISRLIS